MRADLTVRSLQESDGPLVLQLIGVIDAHTLDPFEEALRGAMQEGLHEIVLDCEELRYVNSAGFGELIRYHDQLKEQGGRLVLARVPTKVGVILEMLGLKSLIPVATGLEEARHLARHRPPSRTEGGPGGHGEATAGKAEVSPAARARTEPKAAPTRPDRTATPRRKTVVCAVCDARLRIEGEGEWSCASCGAPFSVTRQGGVAFDWSRAEADGVHLTFDVSPRTLAAFAGLLEGILIERRVSHARMRRFAREAAHVCHLLGEHAFEQEQPGTLHVLALAGPQRLHVRVVDRGRSLQARADRIFSTQKRLFLDFRYGSQAEGINVTEFAFAYAGSGVFVS
ncbi:MAG: STAS domain-containing protein [Planctomycetota bacterium]